MSTTVHQSVLNKNRQDKFLLVLTMPRILKEVTKSSVSSRASEYLDQDSLQYSIHGSVVPDIVIPDVDAKFNGQTAKYTSYTRPAYPAVTVGFTVDNGYNNWWVLWYWLNLINNATEGFYNAKKIVDSNPIKNVHSYETNITVYGLDEYNEKKIQFDYDRAFITGLGSIKFDYRTPELIESSFTFAFGQLKTQLV